MHEKKNAMSVHHFFRVVFVTCKQSDSATAQWKSKMNTICTEYLAETFKSLYVWHNGCT